MRRTINIPLGSDLEPNYYSRLPTTVITAQRNIVSNRENDQSTSSSTSSSSSSTSSEDYNEGSQMQEFASLPVDLQTMLLHKAGAYSTAKKYYLFFTPDVKNKRS